MSRPVTSYTYGSTPVDLGNVFSPMVIYTHPTPITANGSWTWSMSGVTNASATGLYVYYTKSTTGDTDANVCFVMRNAFGYKVSNFISDNPGFGGGTFSASGSNITLTVSAGDKTMNLYYYLFLPL